MTQPCPYLSDLTAELLALWASPEEERRRRLWADHFSGRTRQIPVSCSLFKNDMVWRQILPEESFRYREGLPRALELHLRHHLWRAQHLLDDFPHDPLFTLGALPELAPDELWGLPVESLHSGTPGGAYKPVPPLADPDNLSRLRCPEFRFDLGAARRQEEQVRELVGEDLPLAFACDALHYGPFEWAVRLRGMDNLLLDVYDRPAWLHELMDLITTGMVAYHRARGEAGFVSTRPENHLHCPWDDWPGDGLRTRLAESWVYCHAQSAASYGPDTYAEFVQPYNERLAQLFARVYYHGCEDLTQKVRVIRDLPHLWQFHVSPWSQVAPIAAALPEHVVMEVHSHPTNVLFLWDEGQMRAELERLVRDAGDHLFNLKLCDIQTINADGGAALITWSRVAREVAAAARG